MRRDLKLFKNYQVHFSSPNAFNGFDMCTHTHTFTNSLHRWLNSLAVCWSGSYKALYNNNLTYRMKNYLWKTAGGCDLGSSILPKASWPTHWERFCKTALTPLAVSVNASEPPILSQGVDSVFRCWILWLPLIFSINGWVEPGLELLMRLVLSFSIFLTAAIGY